MASTTKRSFNGRLKTPRTRTGCLPCRKRRLKCDEKKPACRRCEDRCWSCEYGVQLIWPDEPRPTGKSRQPKPNHLGRPAVDSKSRFFRTVPAGDKTDRDSGQSGRCPNTLWTPFINTTLADFSCPSYPCRARQRLSTGELETKRDTVTLAHPELLNSSTQIQLPVSNLTESVDMTPFARRLFHFYVHSMCPKCILLDKNSRSYRMVLVPIALQSSLVFNSLLALAASQVRSQAEDSSYQETALRYQGFSLRELAQRISSFNGIGESASKTEILGTILMLCLFEVMNNTFKVDYSTGLDWKVHSSGAQRVLDSPILDLRYQCNIEMSSFLGQMLSARHVLQCTTISGYTDNAKALGTAEYWLSKTTRPLREINCFAGCSNELLFIISHVVRLVRQHGCGLLNDVANCKTMLEARINSLAQGQPSFGKSEQDLQQMANIKRTSTTTGENRFIHIAEAYRHATIILTEYLNSGEPTDENLTIKNSTECILSEASMKSALSIPQPGKACRSSPLWPVFIASCHATHDDLRFKVLQNFKNTMEKDATSSDVLEPMAEIIQDVWKQYDLGNDSICQWGEMDGNNWRFPWELILSHRGWDLSWS